MLPSESLPMPPAWRDLLEQLAPVFARRSTYRLFTALACGMILADRGTVTGMAAAAGIGQQWRRACWFFAGAGWDVGRARPGGRPADREIPARRGTTGHGGGRWDVLRRWGRQVFAARWAYDGSAQGGKKIAFGNTWVVAAIVVRLPFCPSPVALPVLFRLWRGKGTASQVELAAADGQAAGRGVPRPPGPRDRGCRLPRRIPGRRGDHLDDPAAGQRGAVTGRSRRRRASAAGPGSEGRPASAPARRSRRTRTGPTR